MTEYTIRPEVARDCFWELADRSFHPHLAGYLGMKRSYEIVRQQEGVPYTMIEGVEFDYTGFFDAFLRVRDDNNPYLVPFKKSEATPHNVWFNSNVAGTYAPSSVRDSQPFDEIVDIDTSVRPAVYSLVDNHAPVAWEALCEMEPIPIDALAGFLYRDFSVELDHNPSFSDLVDIFRAEFGYLGDDQNMGSEFEMLFESNTVGAENAFEVMG